VNNEVLLCSYDLRYFYTELSFVILQVIPREIRLKLTASVLPLSYNYFVSIIQVVYVDLSGFVLL